MPAAAPVVVEEITAANGGDLVPKAEFLMRGARAEFDGLLDFVHACAGSEEFQLFEDAIVPRVFVLGCLLVGLFLQLSSEKLEVPIRQKRGRRKFRRQPPKRRVLKVFFGSVPYWRVYAHRTNGRGGFFPLDHKLGLTKDRFSFGALGRAVRLATMMSFACAQETMKSFLGWAPSTKTIEQAVLGLGNHTEAWFEQAPPPDDDGEILVIQIDGKATPTATKAELRKRRRKRGPRSEHKPKSRRHRGRDARQRRGPRKRRRKGDKAKNGRQVNVVVMYTLRQAVDDDGKPILEGPHNVRVYASYAPKRHAFAVARREAEKRGFGPDCRKTVQLLTDGDRALERLGKEFLPHALHSLDVIHAVEYLWRAGACVFREGSTELQEWVATRRRELYEGKVFDMLDQMNETSGACPTLSRFYRFQRCINYLMMRTHMMNYRQLSAFDLELGTGMVEGAVRYVVAQRFDEGGMRWIRERAEALLQLRCIAINGDWDEFLRFAHKRVSGDQRRKAVPVRILRGKPAPLPTFGLAG
jgi:hypothetical protein